MEEKSKLVKVNDQKKPRRIETKLNAHLSEVIPVVYGAVLSYAMYVLVSRAVSSVYRFVPLLWQQIRGSRMRFLSI